MHGNWTLQYGFAKPSEQSFKFEEGVDAAFHGFWLWPCTMLNVTPIKGMMTVIYEFPVDAETTLQNYDIYFTNEELTEEQKQLIEWYRNVFRPEDLRLVESVQKGLKSRGYRGQGRIMADTSGSGIPSMALPISISGRPGFSGITRGFYDRFRRVAEPRRTDFLGRPQCLIIKCKKSGSAGLRRLPRR